MKSKSSLVPDTNGDLDRRLVWLFATRLSICRSLYLSIRYGGVFLVARGTRLKFGAGAKVRLSRGAFFCIGFTHFSPTPASLNLGRGAEMVISGTTQIMRGTRVYVNHGGRLSFGSRSYVNDCSQLMCFEELSIGAGCSIAWNTNILDTNIHEITIDGTQHPRSSPVRIEDGVWIGTGATILPGVTVGAGAVIAAGSVVTKDVPPATLVGGNPAKVIRHNVSWQQ